MRRSPTWIVVVGVLLGLTAKPSTVQAGIWVTLAAGLPGSSTPTSESEFWFDSPHAPPIVALDKLVGGTTAQATTGGGTSFFGGDGTPILLNLADGSAYIANGNPPAAATTRGPNGTTAASPASAAPVAGGTIPSTAELLGLNLAVADASGNRDLTATVTSSSGTSLGTATVTIPSGGWWVLGLTPGDNDSPDTGGPGPIIGGGGGDSGDGNPPPPPGGGSPAATPEPSTLALMGIGGLGSVVASGWRRMRMRSRSS